MVTLLQYKVNFSNGKKCFKNTWSAGYIGHPDNIKDMHLKRSGRPRGVEQRVHCHFLG